MNKCKLLFDELPLINEGNRRFVHLAHTEEGAVVLEGLIALQVFVPLHPVSLRVELPYLEMENNYSSNKDSWLSASESQHREHDRVLLVQWGRLCKKVMRFRYK